VSTRTQSPLPPRARLGEDEQRAWGGFLRAHANLVAELDRELESAHGLPLRSYDVLIQLARAPEGRLRMSELADAVVLSRSGLTRLVDRLARQGYVERRPCPTDARGAWAVLTPAGRERLREASGTHIDSVRRRFLGRFSAQELRRLGDFWERLGASPPPGASG
jgi:DNA-binding MarR family transcriptional regulator